VVEPPKVHALHISEYVEGSANYKAIEIFASEASTLDGCRLLFFFNGGVEPSAIALEGTLGAGQALSLCTSELAAQVGSSCTHEASLRFNGNDAIVLECSGSVRDTFGQVGNDPRSGWGSGEVITVNRTLRRRCDPHPLAANHPFDPAEQWGAFPVDSFDDLGVHTCLMPDDEGTGGSAGDAGNAGEAGDTGAESDTGSPGQGGAQAT
jgi:predicted extracellular nuclease